MINVEFENWEEEELKARVVNKISEKVIQREFKLYGDIPDNGCYTPYDKFKNYVANLVADRIFKYMVENDEIKARINSSIDKAEKTIISNYMKRGNGKS